MALFEASEEMVCALDRKWRCVYVNRAVERLAGQSRDQMLGQSVWELFPGLGASEARAALRRAMGRKRAVEFECALPRLAVKVAVRAMPSDVGLMLLSHQTAGEDSPSESLPPAADMEAVPRRQITPEISRKRPPPGRGGRDHFLAVLSHELRTPLTPVVMTVAALEMDRSLPAQVRDDLAMIRRNIELETRLIDDLLDVTRIASGKLHIQRQDADVHEAIGHVVQMIRPELSGKELDLWVDLSAKDPGVWGDSARLQQIVWNILNNAIKFTPAGGKIAVRSWNPDERTIAVEIRDNGAGIEAALLPRLFDAFAQGDRAVRRQFGGLGLGLAIAKSLVELHGGSIGAHSEGKDRGAVFTLGFPIRAPIERLIDRIQPLSPAQQQGQRPQVLLVEDHMDTQRTLRRLLEIQGYEVHVATTVKEGQAILAASAVDVIVSDIGLPDASGLDLMRAARGSRANIGGIAVSGFGTDADKRASEDAGFSAHLVKPIDIHELQRLIQELLAKKAAAPAAKPAMPEPT